MIRDGDLYRLYYRGSQLEVTDGKLKAGGEDYCYAESRDGIHFTKPNLGLHEFDGSKDNNIFWAGVGSHNFAPFLDTNPDCPPESRFKALGGTAKEGGLFAFQSADGIHWSLMREEPVVTKGAFDSQNLAFWDEATGSTVLTFATFTKGVTTGKVWKPAGYRAIRTASSRDFLNWERRSRPDVQGLAGRASLHQPDRPVLPSAAHLDRHFQRATSNAAGPIRCERCRSCENRQSRAAAHLRYGTALTEGLLMASRDGVHFERWNEAFLRPGPERPGDVALRAPVHRLARGRNEVFAARRCRMRFRCTPPKARGTAATTRSAVTRCVWTDSSPFRRRLERWATAHEATDVHADRAGVELRDVGRRQRPRRDSGRRRHTDNGFSLADCHEIFGDSTARRVQWNSDADLSTLAGRPVRLRFSLKDADLYSFRFLTKELKSMKTRSRSRGVIYLSVQSRAPACAMANRAFGDSTPPQDLHLPGCRIAATPDEPGGA